MVDVVVPTLGRPSLVRLLRSLGTCRELPAAVFVVFDARSRASLDVGSLPARVAARVGVLRARRPGPAAARNAGWRAATADWVVFLDDDVIVTPGWSQDLQGDLEQIQADVAASQGRVRVPLARGMRPTDWERNVRALEDARFATADMAYRRAALLALDGFDERFERAYREDSDLALRALAAGERIAQGAREAVHPVGPERFWGSVARQTGNADDALMRALHGRGWRERAGAPRGRRARHVAITAALAGTAVAHCMGAPRAARLCAGAWALGTSEFAWRRIAPGPRDAAEVSRMVTTSIVIPPAATWHWLRGWAGVASGAARRAAHEDRSRAAGASR